MLVGGRPCAPGSWCDALAGWGRPGQRVQLDLHAFASLHRATLVREEWCGEIALLLAGAAWCYSLSVSAATCVMWTGALVAR
jgi:hypothetical protein